MNVIEQARIYNQGVEEGKRQAAQKPWVGLDEDEIALINADYPNPQGFARAIEAKLREKNGGAA
jgi:phage protein U